MLSIYSIILGLLATTISLQSSVAALAITSRATDITCGGQFPLAGGGFAKRPDRCSSWSDNPAQVRDKWGSANFGGVCDDHDRCYYTIGANVDGCNDNFCSGLKSACRSAYCTKKIWPTNTRICEPVTYGACVAIAEGYCAGVKAVAASTYKKAQDLQKSYDSCIAGKGGLAPPVVCSNGQPEGATWKEYPDGVMCKQNTYVCRNGKIVLTGSVRKPSCIEP